MLPVAVWEYSSFLSQFEDMYAELTDDSKLGKNTTSIFKQRAMLC